MDRASASSSAVSVHDLPDADGDMGTRPPLAQVVLAASCFGKVNVEALDSSCACVVSPSSGPITPTALSAVICLVP